jgi:hypothetical protein
MSVSLDLGFYIQVDDDHDSTLIFVDEEDDGILIGLTLRSKWFSATHSCH